MNVLDIIILVILIFLVVKSLFRGFIREVASLAGVVLGIWLGIRFLPDMSAFLKSLLPPNPFLQVISFAVIFLVVLILCNLLGWGMKTLFKKALLGWLDRSLGAGLAIMKGIIITYIGVWLLMLYVPASTPLITNSKLVPIIKSAYQSIRGFISPQQFLALKEKMLKKKEKEEKITENLGKNKGGT